MKLKEDNQLGSISKQFSEAVKKFTKRDYKSASEDFNTIIKDYNDSEFYSVLEIQSRAKSYKNICDLKTSKKKASQESENDMFNELLFYINTEDQTEYEKILKKIETKKISSPYLDYLKSINAYKNGDEATTLSLLKKAIAKDEKFKIVAHNEPDLKELQENEEFLAIIE